MDKSVTSRLEGVLDMAVWHKMLRWQRELFGDVFESFDNGYHAVDEGVIFLALEKSLDETTISV